MDLFTYLMAKNGQNTQRDLFSYLLGKKASGGSGTYTTFSGTSLNISNSIKAKIKNFMLNSTELTQDGTPTPDNPVDVNVITGSNNVKMQNKNLFNKNNIVYINNKILNDSGVEIFDSTGGYTKMYIQIKANTEYTISGLSNIGGKRIYYFDENKMFISRSTSYPQVSTITFTTPSNAKYIDIQYYINGNDFNNWQIEQGSSATEYVEHQEQNYPITLGTLDYCKIGDYADQFFKNTIDSEFYDSTLLENEWYLKKNIGKIDSYNGETITTPYISTTGGLDTGATVYYGLETPAYIHISQEDYPTLKTELDNLYNNAQSYNGQTNITQTNEDLPFNISVDVKVS